MFMEEYRRMKLLDSAQMRNLDATTINDIGVPGIVLMENASRGLYEVIDSEFAPLYGKRILIICGKGNNGGDGFAVARHLLSAGARPDVVLAAKPSEIKGDAKINMDVCGKLGIKITSLADPKKLSPLRKKIKDADLIIDALLGTGVKGEVRPFFLKIIKAINRAECPIVSVDVPSGISVDDGRVFNDAVNADHTVTFGAAKIGLFMQPAASNAGNVYVVDIGIPRHLLEQAKTSIYLTTRSYMGTVLKDRPDTVHKGDCGKLLIVSGAQGMSGAASLAGMAALRAGVGLAYIAVPESIVEIVEKNCTEGVIIPLPEDEKGRIDISATDQILEKIKDVDAVVVGPGLSVCEGTTSLVKNILENSKKPVLVDADGLNAVAKEVDALKNAKAPVIISPHPGEMARLTGSTPAKVQAERLATAREFAEKNDVIVLLKGANTLVAAPDGTVMVNPTGNAGMATAGSGDVLSGLIGTLLAEGMNPFLAAVCAAFLHGMTGDNAAEEKGRRSVIASDLVACISSSIREIQGQAG